MSNPDSASHPFEWAPGALPPLDSWTVLHVAGDDAAPFLQGQLSADVHKLAPGQATWASYNSAKGRMLATLRVHRAADGGFELRLPEALADAVARRLRMFVLRSKVTLATTAAPRADAAHAERRALIEAGVPVIHPATQDRWVAQMANLDLIGGISFDKGCYTGQEVIARLHYLGNLKKRMFRVRGAGTAPLPGTAIHLPGGDGQAVGDIVDAVEDGHGFVASAVLQLAAASSGALQLDQGAALSRPERYAYLSA